MSGLQDPFDGKVVSVREWRQRALAAEAKLESREPYSNKKPTKCSVCGRPVLARGMCASHYHAALRDSKRGSGRCIYSKCKKRPVSGRDKCAEHLESARLNQQRLDAAKRKKAKKS